MSYWVHCVFVLKCDLRKMTGTWNDARHISLGSVLKTELLIYNYRFPHLLHLIPLGSLATDEYCRL